MRIPCLLLGYLTFAAGTMALTGRGLNSTSEGLLSGYGWWRLRVEGLVRRIKIPPFEAGTR